MNYIQKISVDNEESKGLPCLWSKLEICTTNPIYMYVWGNIDSIYTTTYSRQSEYIDTMDNVDTKSMIKVYDIFSYCKWRLLSILQFVMVHWLKRLTLVLHSSRVICIFHWRNICYPITKRWFSRSSWWIPMF